MLPISSTTGWMYPIMKGWSAHRAPGAPSPTRDILRSFPQSILLMTITCRIPLVMLFISPARGGANDPVDTRPYSHFTGSDELFNVSVNLMNSLMVHLSYSGFRAVTRARMTIWEAPKLL